NIPLHTGNDKIMLMKLLRKFVFENDGVNPDDLVNWLYDELGMEIPQATDDPIDKKLSWEQVSEMNNNPLFKIGGHTHTHSVMSRLDEQDLNFEIDRCLDLLKRKAGVETEHFAYPQGQAN